MTYLPASYWVIGLGHLGQACTWTIALLPYGRFDNVRIVLQDTDTMTEANESMGVLSRTSMRGCKKTRMVTRWLEQKGFTGVDDLESRRVLEHPGIARIVESGPGNTVVADALKIRLHSFPGTRAVRLVISRADDSDAIERQVQRNRSQPAYEAMETHQQLDNCGLDQLAGVSVGIPFVDSAASALVIAESICMAIGEQHHDVIDVNLVLPERTRAVFAPRDSLGEHRANRRGSIGRNARAAIQNCIVAQTL